MESSPVVLNGRLIVIIGERYNSSGTKIIIKDYFNGEIINIIDTPDFGLISAIVVNDMLYVFGSTDWGVDSNDKALTPPNKIKFIKTSDLMSWSSQEIVYTAPADQAIFNTSVTYDGKSFVMAYEIKGNTRYEFTPAFLISNNLQEWAPIGTPFDPNRYAACPTIRFIGEYYYLIYLSFINGKYQSVLSRSKNLHDWEHATTIFLSPNDSEGINNSDVDMVEFQGRTYFVYSDGDQRTYGNIKKAIFTGTQKQFFEGFTFQRSRL